LDLDFEYVQLDLTKGRTPPAGLPGNESCRQVLVLVDDDLVLSESVAIVLYHVEKHLQTRYLPEDLRALTEVNRWPLFKAAELQQPLWRIALRTTKLYDCTRDKISLDEVEPRHTHPHPIKERLAAEISTRAGTFSTCPWS
jgi:glutathione S-transferase